MPRAAVVVPNWNGAHFLGPCLDSLQAQTHPARLIVVDGGSIDGSRELVAERYPQVEVIALGRNLGFAGAANRGIDSALSGGTDYVALLNNDAVAEHDWLEQLIRVAEAEPGLGTVTSKLLRLDRSMIDSTGDFYSSWGWAYPRGRDELDRGQYDDPADREVFCGTGGASLYRAEMLRQVGGFDEDYFAYLEDQDLGFRAQLMGWRAAYCATAVAYHHLMGTSRTIAHFDRYQMIRNSIYLYVKNVPAPLCWRYLPKLLAGLGLMGLNDFRRRRFRAIAGAYVEAIRRLPVLLRKRRQVQARRTVPVAYIDSVLIHPLPPMQRRQLRWPPRSRR